MNRENMLKLADALEHTNKFYMRHWACVLPEGQAINRIENLLQNNCDTTCCIAGHAALLSNKTRGDIQDVANTWLELSQSESLFLFLGKWTPHHIRETDNKLAAQVCRDFANHGFEYVKAQYECEDEGYDY